MSVEIRSGNEWLTPHFVWSDLTWSTNLNGPNVCSWSANLPQSANLPFLRRGQTVQLMAGALQFWSGTMADPEIGDDGVWQFHADGLSALSANYLALAAGPAVTMVPNTAIDQAILRGLPWKRSANFSTTAVSTPDTSTGPIMLSELLDSYTKSTGNQWRVDGTTSEVMTYTYSTTPDLYAVPGSGRFGQADDYYFSDVYLWTQTSNNPTDTFGIGTASNVNSRNTYGRKESIQDLTSLGIISVSQANLIGSTLVADASVMAWTNTISPSFDQLKFSTGGQANPYAVRAGMVVRLFGMYDMQGNALPYIDMVISETSYKYGESTITLTPLNYSPRDLEAVFKDTQQSLWNMKWFGHP